MNLLPKNKEEFTKKEYWESFFKKRGNKAFEWYGEYPELCSDLHKYVRPNNKVLIVGCGNSTLGNDLYDVGYKTITNIDISHTVIKHMKKANEQKRPDMNFIQMDATNMSFDNEYFDAIIDKGTLDALMPNDKESTIIEIDKYLEEINRVLKNGGKYLCISLLQEHILIKLIDFFHNSSWLFKIIRCHEAENKAEDNNENVFPVFMVVCSKIQSKSTMIADIFLELNTQGTKAEKPDKVKDLISSIQQSSFLCSHLKNTTIKDDDVVSFEIFETNSSSPRYTAYVIDIPFERENFKYAAFIVPQGREAEWLFSTVEGRKQLAKMSHHNRLTVITMHRNQTYGSLDDIKIELNDIIKKLAPVDPPALIPFLSINSEVGERIIRYEGNSKFSGDYVIEDVKIDEVKYRRLYYLQTQLLIQSEARLKTVKPRRGNPKEIVDPLYLSCKHHLYMTLSILLGNKKESLAVIGLGGGGLCTFLHKFLPKTRIKVIDIDEDMLKIATEWFGFVKSEEVVVEILDGLIFLENSSKSDEKYDAILFDVDSKDSSIGMSCPPKQFLEDSTIDNVISSLTDTGIFVLNAVIRDKKIRRAIIQSLKKKFKLITCYKLDEDLNEIIVCFKEDVSTENILRKYKNCCVELNKFIKSNGLPRREWINVGYFMEKIGFE
ncbi:eEF1A lysine and N-terminal methyltransferase homolog [Onthophagus taurus]|uniref:eEF1A lysine and N-terminal methyltransferase homolog n=1 Tax=Onthophagus taurus TaxID=166361 RepID=UPI0039BDB456